MPPACLRLAIAYIARHNNTTDGQSNTKITQHFVYQPHTIRQHSCCVHTAQSTRPQDQLHTTLLQALFTNQRWVQNNRRHYGKSSSNTHVRTDPEAPGQPHPVPMTHLWRIMLQTHDNVSTVATR